jgi:hypothetical protein
MAWTVGEVQRTQVRKFPRITALTPSAFVGGTHPDKLAAQRL